MALGKSVARRDPAHVNPKVKSCMHYMYSFCCSKGLSGQSTFSGLFGHDMKKEMGVIIMIYMYLKHFPEYIDARYMWVHGSDSLGSSVSAEIPFLAFLALVR